jgi:hypothetical protein
MFVTTQISDDVFHEGSIEYGDHGLRHVAGQRTQTGSFSYQYQRCIDLLFGGLYFFIIKQVGSRCKGDDNQA